MRLTVCFCSCPTPGRRSTAPSPPPSGSPSPSRSLRSRSPHKPRPSLSSPTATSLASTSSSPSRPRSPGSPTPRRTASRTTRLRPSPAGSGWRTAWRPLGTRSPSPRSARPSVASYTVGAAEIGRIRAEAERALGRQFDIRAFHQAVLEDGTIPLPMLAEKIDRWVKERR
ncbi:MAG: DUF885 family protein [Gemmatimonadales bacterium]